MSKPTLEQYFKNCQEKGIYTHTVSATSSDSNSLFIIHPANVNGETLDFSVKGNELTQIHISPEEDMKAFLIKAFENRSMEELEKVARTLGII